jgi:acyl-CoA synthetase (AMP-forming)/AMP-acid ligase II
LDLTSSENEYASETAESPSELTSIHFGEVQVTLAISGGIETMNFIEPHFEELDRRSNRLARVLRGMGVNSGTVVAIVVCDDTEKLVALAAVRKIGADVAEISCGESPREFERHYRTSGATLTLACAEGSQLWLNSDVGGLILGDGEGVRWWKLAELRESCESLLDAEND